MAEECEQARLHVPIQVTSRVSTEIFVNSKALPVSGALEDRRAGPGPYASPG